MKNESGNENNRKWRIDNGGGVAANESRRKAAAKAKTVGINGGISGIENIMAAYRQHGEKAKITKSLARRNWAKAASVSNKRGGENQQQWRQTAIENGNISGVSMKISSEIKKISASRK
jgi:hypothetical protein